ncbi:aspartate/glutamate racemase family protein [Cellulomonas sp. ES6]|uniref:aspartate/glutamate racemase family protein n=1 Tax=Cellulomonas sp. ES6 TaxID=3039384 RepID=UPI0024B6BAEC|nr:aspartate/glutamate racemase family protein [Cellulomonas sp. ES6]WHP16379.1 aspartate/glutamate racemase family protein [Cellulomonas sp. ES6]
MTTGPGPSAPASPVPASPVPASPAPGSAGTVGLLHTVPALAQRFDADVDAAAPLLRRLHVVDGWLLATAVAQGVTPQVEAAVAAHVRHLVDAGATAVLVTCSSIGEAAEAAAATVDVPVLRVDASMAREAVTLASAPGARGRVAVLATLASTLGPTGRLVQRAAADAGADVDVEAGVVDGAAAARDAGDGERADRLVAEAVADAARGADVVVLAQASMAGAAALAEPAVPVLTSPAGGVAALVRALATTTGRVPGER